MLKILPHAANMTSFHKRSLPYLFGKLTIQTYPNINGSDNHQKL